MRPQFLCAVRRFTCVCHHAKTVVDAGDIRTWRTMVILITGKIRRPPIWAPCRNKMAQVPGSPVYICVWHLPSGTVANSAALCLPGLCDLESFLLLVWTFAIPSKAGVAQSSAEIEKEKVVFLSFLFFFFLFFLNSFILINPENSMLRGFQQCFEISVILSLSKFHKFLMGFVSVFCMGGVSGVLFIFCLFSIKSILPDFK